MCTGLFHYWKGASRMSFRTNAEDPTMQNMQSNEFIALQITRVHIGSVVYCHVRELSADPGEQCKEPFDRSIPANTLSVRGAT